MKRLTQKTFALLLAISLAIGVFSYACIWIFLPYVGENRAKRQLEQRTDELVSVLWSTEKADSEPLFLDFIRETGAVLILLDKEGRSLSPFTFEETTISAAKGSRYPFKFAVSEEEYVLVICTDQNRSEEITGAIINSMPYVAVLIVLLSFLGAWFFSRYATAPILRINKIAERLSKLDFSWYCPDVREDEIGMLAKSINELSDRLHEALDELYQKNAILEDEITLEKERERRRMLFFSGVSHELKTPIAVVIGQLEGMQAGIGVYKDREKYLGRSAEILQSLNDFIKEVLLVSHIDMTDQRETELVNLSDLTNALLEEYTDYAEPSAISFSGEIEEGVVVCGDEMLLGKALGNIIGNAAIYSPQKGHVAIRLARRQQGIELTVENGPAHIEEKHLPHVFEAFYRADEAAGQGSGLGLYITRMILETYHIPHTIENTGGSVKFTALFQEASS